MRLWLCWRRGAAWERRHETRPPFVDILALVAVGVSFCDRRIVGHDSWARVSHTEAPLVTLPLNRDTLRAAYNLLNETPPFAKWNLPDGEEVVFKVVRTRHKQAWYQWNGERHTITVSQGRTAHTVTLLTAMAHEMIHLHLEQQGWESSARNCDTHNMAFRGFAVQVCKSHGFDPKAFY